jgi:hypothetical protein
MRSSQDVMSSASVADCPARRLTTAFTLSSRVLVRDAHDGRLEHGRVLVEDVLNLTRPHLVG